VRDLIYIGLDNVAGYFDSSELEGWLTADHPTQSYEVATPVQIAARMTAGEVTVIDVRHTYEWEAGHLAGAQHVMLGYLTERLDEIPTDRPIVVQCRAGARSAIAASLLQSKGIPAVINLKGGINAWTAAGLPVER
jgi:hydroxyacylglutathione hydrolase